MNDRRGDWIFTQSGVRFYPFDPRPQEVDLLDMARALTLKCRWSGHCARFYSVATHSQRVARLAEHLACEALLPGGERAIARVGLYGLLHDGHEAYLTDVPSPLKKHLWVCAAPASRKATEADMVSWDAVEQHMDEAIFAAVGLEQPHEFVDGSRRLINEETARAYGFVKKADRLLLKLEAEEQFPESVIAQAEVWPSDVVTDHVRQIAGSDDDYDQDPVIRSKLWLCDVYDRINLLGLPDGLDDDLEEPT